MGERDPVCSSALAPGEACAPLAASHICSHLSLSTERVHTWPHPCFWNQTRSSVIDHDLKQNKPIILSKTSRLPGGMCTFFGVKHMRLDYLLPCPEQMMWGKHGLTSDSSKMRSPPTSQGCRTASHGPQRTCRVCPIVRQIQCRVKATRAETPTSLQICSKAPSYTLSKASLY